MSPPCSNRLYSLLPFERWVWKLEKVAWKQRLAPSVTKSRNIVATPAKGATANEKRELKASTNQRNVCLFVCKNPELEIRESPIVYLFVNIHKKIILSTKIVFFLYLEFEMENFGVFFGNWKLEIGYSNIQFPISNFQKKPQNFPFQIPSTKKIQFLCSKWFFCVYLQISKQLEIRESPIPGFYIQTNKRFSDWSMPSILVSHWPWRPWPGWPQCSDSWSQMAPVVAFKRLSPTFKPNARTVIGSIICSNTEGSRSGDMDSINIHAK